MNLMTLYDDVINEDCSMIVPETLNTPHLILRYFRPEDAERVAELAGDIHIASGVLNIPHPYTIDDARDWIGQHRFLRDHGEEIIYAITVRESAILAGAISLRVNTEHAHAEMGYWIGRPYQGYGYATEAAGSMLELGFRGLSLHRIYARHLSWNTTSSGVLTRIGMVHEGVMRGHASKWGVFHDVHWYSIMDDEYYSSSVHADHPGRDPSGV